MKTGSPAEGVEIHVMKPPDWRNDSKKLVRIIAANTLILQVLIQLLIYQGSH